MMAAAYSLPANPDNKRPRSPHNFMTLVDKMSAALEASTSAAAQLPDKSDLNFHRTLDRKFAKELDSVSSQVLKITNRLLETALQSRDDEAPRQKLRPLMDEDDVVDDFTRKVIGTVDTLLEQADSNLDEASGRKRGSAIEVKPAFAAAAGAKLPGPKAIESRLPDSLFNASIDKPQLLFKDEVQNSRDFEWTPTLPYKHHAMVPLGHVLAEEDMPHYSEEDLPTDLQRERDLRMRQHPYFYETKHLPYPTSLFTATPPQVPKSFEETPFEFVDTPERLAAMTEVLKQAKEIAVDLEAHNNRSYRGFTCLMQISTRECDWVVDTLALRAELREHKLGGVLADPSVVKVFHGAESDIVWLQRDFDIYVVNLFDTYHASKVLEFPKFSLAGLLTIYCNFDADKKYQMADWRIRPIPQEMLFYARSDTHFLLYIYDNLRNSLLARASRTPSPAIEGDSTPVPNPQRAIRQVLERSENTSLKLFSSEEYDEKTGIGMYGWSSLARKLSKDDRLGRPGHILQRLHAWRDDVARELDESPHFVLANHKLLALARAQSTTPKAYINNTVRDYPLAQERIKDLARVFLEANEEYKQFVENEGSELKAALVARPFLKTTPAPVPEPAVREPPVPLIAETVDVWGDVSTKPEVTGRAASSSLFGAVAKAAPPTPQSSLFGATLPTAVKRVAVLGALRERESSPEFCSVQAAIHKALLPRVDDANPVEPSDSGNTNLESAVAEPESVEFVPAAKRQNVGSDQQVASLNAQRPMETSASTTPAESAGPTTSLAATDGIVAVKKKKAKKVKDESAPGVDAEAVPKAKSKKAKIKATDIPVFDYAAEPNLLDDPKAAAPKTKKKKANKETKKPAGHIDTSGFRRPPSDPTQPKSGNRSTTFSH